MKKPFLCLIFVALMLGISIQACSGSGAPEKDLLTGELPETDSLPDTAAQDTLPDTRPDLVEPQDTSDPGPREGIAFWWEDSDLTQLVENLDMIRDLGFEVNIALHQGEVDWDALSQVTIKAAESGVKINLWPLIKYEEGYFANVRTADPFKEWWDEILAYVVDKDLPVDTFVVDVEPPIQVMTQIGEIASHSPDIDKISGYLTERFEPEIWDSGVSTLSEMVVQTQALGYKVCASTIFLILDDYQDGDKSVQKVFDTPIDDIPWDEVSFQVYRSTFNDLIGGIILQPDQLISPFIVHDYALTAKQKFGDRAAMDIGVAPSDLYHPQDLKDDLAAVYAAGLDDTRVNVYALHMIMRTEEVETWLDFRELPEFTLTEDAATELIRELIKSVDKEVNL